MKTKAFIAACMVLIAMSQTAMDAFSEISGAKIIAGVIHLGDTESWIYAVGIMEGVQWEITCRWIGGQPAWIKFERPKIWM